MSPVRACNRHGRPRCPICAHAEAERQARARRDHRSARETAAMRDEVLEAHGDLCMYCRVPAPDAATGRDGELVLAHVVAHADGGTWTVENLRAAHRLCNLRAGR